ncbi:hypothetical protein EG329_008904 [Mollisiaceae sp. DMI_Dod_QoI]|nr:hypothetical protein EG329_008904 [Helotiales sp. DMI_Dod_QoI]
MAPLQIAIVGAGIGGPAAAISLARNGHHVTIYERSTDTSEVGYAFRITDNADRCLKHLGIDTIEGGAVSSNVVKHLNQKGEVTGGFDERLDPEKAKKGSSVFAFRPALNKQLMDAAAENGAQIRLGAKIKSVDVETTTLILEDGETVAVDLIIASDGLHSAIRSYVLDSNKYVPQCSSGHSAIRFMVLKSDAQNDPLMSTLVDENAHMFAWKGDDNTRSVVVYPVEFGKEYNVAMGCPASLTQMETSNGDAAAAVAYNHTISYETVLNLYSDFDPKLKRLLSLADPNGFRVWPLMDMDEIPAWSRTHTVLLGDAAHPLLAFSFSGASMAIEDAVTLGVLFPGDVGKEGITERLKLYEEIRKPRVGVVRSEAREKARGGGSLGNKGYMEFLKGHDAVEFAREKLVEFQERKGDT